MKKMIVLCALLATVPSSGQCMSVAQEKSMELMVSSAMFCLLSGWYLYSDMQSIKDANIAIQTIEDEGRCIKRGPGAKSARMIQSKRLNELKREKALNQTWVGVWGAIGVLSLAGVAYGYHLNGQVSQAEGDRYRLMVQQVQHGACDV